MNIISGDDVVIDALLYGMPTQQTNSFFRREYENFVGSAVGDYAQSLANRAKELYTRFAEANILGMMQAAFNKSQSVVKPDTIYRFNEMVDFQTAQPMMQRYIMANPVVREKYHQQLCDGYSESFVDAYPGKIGESHPLWQQVENGHVKFDEEGMSWTNYSNAFDEEGNLHLNAYQQHSLLATWRTLEDLFAKGEYDPTSVWNGKL